LSREPTASVIEGKTKMIVALPFPATFDDLMRVEGKAELIGGRIVEYMATGHYPALVGENILFSLRPYVRARSLGFAHGDNAGYTLDPPLTSTRESFSPDVSFYDGHVPSRSMKFIEGAPKFAVEVRSENDYGPAQDRAYAAKRDDYFEAGTLVVWDVDPLAQTVAKHTPNGSTVFHVGDIADAEPAVPGWTMAVADIFADM
jgi:Uma2 family endonuclease